MIKTKWKSDTLTVDIITIIELGKYTAETVYYSRRLFASSDVINRKSANLSYYCRN